MHGKVGVRKMRLNAAEKEAMGEAIKGFAKWCIDNPWREHSKSSKWYVRLWGHVGHFFNWHLWRKKEIKSTDRSNSIDFKSYRDYWYKEENWIIYMYEVKGDLDFRDRYIDILYERRRKDNKDKDSYMYQNSSEEARMDAEVVDIKEDIREEEYRPPFMKDQKYDPYGDNPSIKSPQEFEREAKFQQMLANDKNLYDFIRLMDEQPLGGRTADVDALGEFVEKVLVNRQAQLAIKVMLDRYMYHYIDMSTLERRTIERCLAKIAMCKFIHTPNAGMTIGTYFACPTNVNLGKGSTLKKLLIKTTDIVSILAREGVPPHILSNVQNKIENWVSWYNGLDDAERSRVDSEQLGFRTMTPEEIEQQRQKDLLYDKYLQEKAIERFKRTRKDVYKDVPERIRNLNTPWGEKYDPERWYEYIETA